VVVCAIAAVAATVTAAVLGHPAAGLAMAAGLLLGSLNGYLIQGLLNRGTPFAASSLVRILFFSSLVLMGALILRNDAWALALGIGLAQLVMVGVGIRKGFRP
jgi:hypothetical protein